MKHIMFDEMSEEDYDKVRVNVQVRATSTHENSILECKMLSKSGSWYGNSLDFSEYQDNNLVYIN
ncbi:hypothetical protein AC480_02410 [miscellaneous Crenarchaeota group archaeon SMTZ1-55]|nr:MAG: hypothetical protein AC480_02410 [miscellaneous Crenarchaeota group archaeon SMTZ1-55]